VSEQSGSSVKVSTGVDADGAPLVAIAGELDLASVDTVRTAIDPVLSASPSMITFDLEDLSFMDSSGISLLVQVSNQVSRVQLVRVSPIVHRVLEATGLLEIFGLAR
jgi:anti-sigma B factor antagonist